MADAKRRWGLLRLRVLSPPEGVLLPAGSKTLRVEADVSAALKSGSYAIILENTAAGRYEWGHDSRLKTDVWEFALLPSDWDFLDASELALSIFAHGPDQRTTPNVLDGPINVKVTVVKDPAWTPAAVRDPFTSIEDPSFVAEGVVELLDAEFPVAQRGYAELPGPASRVPPLTYPIPPGSRQVVIGLVWAPMESCTVGFQCEIGGTISSHRTWADIEKGAQVEEDTNMRIVAFDVPAMVAEDGPYANASATQITLWVNDHVAGLPCWCNPQTIRTDVHLRVEAWNDEADLAEFRTRLATN